MTVYVLKKETALRAMAKKGYNQRMLSQEANLNPCTVSKIFCRNASLSASSAIKLSKALEIPIQDLFDIGV